MKTLKHIIIRDELTSCLLYVGIAVLTIIDDPPQTIRCVLAGMVALKAFRSNSNPKDNDDKTPSNPPAPAPVGVRHTAGGD